MVENRYYSYYQFFSVALVVFSAIFVSVSIFYNYYGSMNKKNIKTIYLIFSLVTGFIVTRLIENIIINIHLATMLRNIQSNFFIILIYIMSYYIFVKEYRLVKIKKMNTKIIFIVIFLFFIFSLKYSLLLDTYLFDKANYSRLYTSLIYLNVIINTCFVYNILLSSTQLNNIFNNKILSIFISVLVIVPLLIYALFASKKHIYVNFIEIAIQCIFCILINLSVYSNREDGTNLIAFNRIGDMCIDFIFAIDMSGNIIYKNKSVRESSFFSRIEKIDSNEIKALFNGEVNVKANHLGKEYLLITEEESKYYFTYKKTQLKKLDTPLGYIITIAEITELIELLFTLESKKKKTEYNNSQLISYSKVAYEIEREKELNTLLEEVINSREEQMEYLSQMISSIKDKTEEQLFEDSINNAISKSNEILHEVRETVSTYRKYFGG